MAERRAKDGQNGISRSRQRNGGKGRRRQARTQPRRPCDSKLKRHVYTAVFVEQPCRNDGCLCKWQKRRQEFLNSVVIRSRALQLQRRLIMRWPHTSNCSVSAALYCVTFETAVFFASSNIPVTKLFAVSRHARFFLSKNKEQGHRHLVRNTLFNRMPPDLAVSFQVFTHLLFTLGLLQLPTNPSLHQR